MTPAMPDFPFRRRPNGILQRSVGSATSIARGDESLWWWSADSRIYRTVGYQERRVSTHGIEGWLGGGITSAYTYNQTRPHLLCAESRRPHAGLRCDDQGVAQGLQRSGRHRPVARLLLSASIPVFRSSAMPAPGGCCAPIICPAPTWALR